ncbi:Virulence factors putative positive transcription regulator BvgA [Seminavis robusta]|uniref:Virulence factors putative positive transcription regulator BvgA n=1 Tax=Seminavis robusta TaxID=568900 RepID=A0A9N8DC61_9STRA|nr:Virulence factors putative positive transcription regulator BvgA [Seminavis robusta]|eukprot:Sro25_g017380.1 Virulence factors putative positive transcription regulator BvgA (318) ;mRNA; f:170483-171436
MKSHATTFRLAFALSLLFISSSAFQVFPNYNFNGKKHSSVYQSSLQVGDHYDDDEALAELDGIKADIDDFSRDDEFQKRANRWILLVDDEASIRKSVGQLLFDRGFQVTACADAPTALQVAKERRDDMGNSRLPDVIVSDIRMPDMDGLEFLQVLRQDDRLQAIPVVLLTAKGMVQDRIAGYNAGADIYLPKPFDPEELLSICDGLIAQYEILNGADIEMDDLRQDLDEIKYMLLEKGGGGVGNGWVDEGTNVFLAPDEREVLELLCQGLRNQEIADKTFLSKRRVEQLLTNMYRKVNVKNRTELVRWAVSSGNVKI